MFVFRQVIGSSIVQQEQLYSIQEKMPSASTKKKRAAAAKAAAAAARPETKAAAEEVDAAERPEAKAAAEEVDASNGSSMSEHSSQNSDVSSISRSVTGGNAA